MAPIENRRPEGTASRFDVQRRQLKDKRHLVIISVKPALGPGGLGGNGHDFHRQLHGDRSRRLETAVVHGVSHYPHGWPPTPERGRDRGNSRYGADVDRTAPNRSDRTGWTAQRFLRLLGAVVGIAMLTVSCAADSEETGVPVGFPTIAAENLGGVYNIVQIEPVDAGPTPLVLSVTPTVELDVVTGSLTIDTACNRHLGSFTLDDQGRASFTIPGGTTDACPDEAAAEDQLLLNILDETSQWAGGDGTLTFSGNAGAMTWSRS